MVGYRVRDDGTDRCRGVHIDDTPIDVHDLDDLRRRGIEPTLDEALTVVAAEDGFWIHMDVDVLADGLMPAVDYRNPDGMTWEELTRIVRGAIATGYARGLDLTISILGLTPPATARRVSCCS